MAVTTSFGSGKQDFYLIKLDENGKNLWERTYGGSGDDYPVSAQQTQDGGFIVAGMTMSFGSGGWDVYIVRTDANGNMIWQRTFGGKNDDGASFVHQADDGYLVVGYTKSFGAGGEDFYILKLDKDGNKVWEKTYGGNDSDRARSAVSARDGGYLVVGSTKSFGAGGMDGLVMKLDRNGNKVWEKTFGASNEDLFHLIKHTSDGGYVIVGYTKSFGAGGSDFYIVKLYENGDREWERFYGKDRDDMAWSVEQTHDGGYIVAGWTKSFGVSMGVLVLKLDASGNKLWEKIYGGDRDDLAYSVQQTRDGGYILAGWTASFAAGPFDVYVIKMDANGNTGPNPK